MIQEDALYLKRNFSMILKPFLEMLEHKKDILNDEDWAVEVLQLETSIIKHPEQYLGRDLPNAIVLVRLVKEILEEFSQDQLALID